MSVNLKKLKEKWGSPFVTREKIEEFSGGLLHPRTMSNLDCKGEGPSGSFKLHRKICYDVDELIKWMEKRIEN